MNALVLVVVVVILLGGVGGAWPRQGSYNAGWGYAPFGGIIGLLVFLLILRLFGLI